DGIRDATVTGVQTCALPIFVCPLHQHIGGAKGVAGTEPLGTSVRANSLLHVAEALDPLRDRTSESRVCALERVRHRRVLQVELEIGRASCREGVGVWVVYVW